MSIDIFEDDPATPAIPPVPALKPVPAPTPAPEPARQSGGNGVLGFVLGVIAAVLIIFAYWNYPTPDDGDDINPPNVKGLHVLVLEETSQRSQLTEGQLAILTGPEMRQWYADNCAKEDGGGIAYRNYDVHDKPETAAWKKLRDLVTLDPPCVLATDGKKTLHFSVPGDPDVHKEKLAPLIKSR